MRGVSQSTRAADKLDNPNGPRLLTVFLSKGIRNVILKITPSSAAIFQTLHKNRHCSSKPPRPPELIQQWRHLNPSPPPRRRVNTRWSTFWLEALQVRRRQLEEVHANLGDSNTRITQYPQPSVLPCPSTSPSIYLQDSWSRRAPPVLHLPPLQNLMTLSSTLLVFSHSSTPHPPPPPPLPSSPQSTNRTRGVVVLPPAGYDQD